MSFDPLYKVHDAYKAGQIPQKTYDLVIKRFPLVAEGIKRVEEASGLNYPYFYVEPSLVVSTSAVEFTQMGILFARTIPVVGDDNLLRVVVQVTAPLIAYGLKGTIHAILAHDDARSGARLRRHAHDGGRHLLAILGATVRLGIPALLVNAFVVGALLGWRIAALHSLVVTLAIAIAAQFASLLVQGVPFTRAYPPGHAKLKTRWQFYLLGMWAIAYLPVRWELPLLNDPWGLAGLLAEGLAVLIVLEIAGRHRARKWTLPPEPDFDDTDPESPTFLNLGPGAGHNPQPAT